MMVFFCLRASFHSLLIHVLLLQHTVALYMCVYTCMRTNIVAGMQKSIKMKKALYLL